MARWFETLFGFAESSSGVPNHDRIRKLVQLETDPASGLSVLRCKDGRSSMLQACCGHGVGRGYQVGRFDTPTLAELRARAVEATARLGSDAASSGLKLSHIAVGDVFLLHSAPENNGAMFQAASQFNCLEFPSPGTTPEDGVTGYAYDRTQGPACSLAAGPATVYRNYFAQMPDGRAGQTADNQLNLLSDVLDAVGGVGLVHVRNGYTNTRDDAALDELNARIAAAGPRGTVLDRLRIGVHSRVEVPFIERYKLGQEPNPVVSQAFCSAISCGYAQGALDKWAPLATIVLDACYEATLWAAAVEFALGYGSGRVLLTFIGGGVFGNRDEWIAEAIGRAAAKVAAAGVPLEVVVCHYGRINSAMKARVDARFKSEHPDAQIV